MTRLRALFRPANLLIVLAGAAALAGMMATQPDYNSAVRPFVSHAAPGDWAETRLIRARFDGWRTADRIVPPDGRARETGGVFLIADLTLAGRGTSTMVDAAWIGATGRRYAATRRVSGLPLQLDDLWLQPGLDSRAVAVFELPPDEIAGGALALTLRLDPALDGTLRLAPPMSPPAHRAVESVAP